MQPNYQQYPQPGYGQPAPQQQYAPHGYVPQQQSPQPGYAGHLQQQYVAPVDSGPIVAADPTGGGGGGDGPLPRHLVGAAVAFICTSYDPNATFKTPQGAVEAKPSITYDVYVLSGPGGAPYVEYGDSQEHGKPVQPNCWRTPAPSWFDGIMCSNKGIVKELSPYAGTNRPLIARVELGSRGGFLLGKVEPQQREALIDLIGRHRRGEWQPPQSEPINGGPRPPAGAPVQQQYAPPAYGPLAGQSWQPQQPPAGYAPVPQQAPPFIASGTVATGAQMQYPVPVQQAPGGYQGPAAPHGFDPAYWATLTPAQQAPFLS